VPLLFNNSHVYLLVTVTLRPWVFADHVPFNPDCLESARIQIKKWGKGSSLILLFGLAQGVHILGLADCNRGCFSSGVAMVCYIHKNLLVFHARGRRGETTTKTLCGHKRDPVL